MKKRTPPKKRRGPAPTGIGKAQLVRMHEDLLERIDGWRSKQADELSRPEAIRRLVEMSLQGRAS